MNKIEQIIGADAMRKLIAEFGGQQLYIPNRIHLQPAQIEMIRTLRSGGVAVREIAKRFSISSRHVYLIIERA